MLACLYHFATMLRTQYPISTSGVVRNLLLLLLAVPPGLLGAQQIESDVLRMSGVYTGELKGQDVHVWVSVPSTLRHTAALLLFTPSQEQAIRKRMRELAGDPAKALRKICAQAEHTEHGYMYHRGYFRIWQSGGGIALIRWQGYGGEVLSKTWEQLELNPYSSLLETSEYPQIKGKQYAFKQIHRDPRSGKLTKIQLTSTGYLQNPFDNPQTLLRFVGPLPDGDLLSRYLNAKEDAAQFFYYGSSELPKSPLPACAQP